MSVRCPEATSLRAHLTFAGRGRISSSSHAWHEGLLLLTHGQRQARGALSLRERHCQDLSVLAEARQGVGLQVAISIGSKGSPCRAFAPLPLPCRQRPSRLSKTMVSAAECGSRSHRRTDAAALQGLRDETQHALEDAEHDALRVRVCNEPRPAMPKRQCLIRRQ